MRVPSDVFDVPQFWKDVQDYINRRKWSVPETADLAGINSSNLNAGLKFNKSTSLFTAYSLGKLCDLDMNKYMKL